MPYSLLSLLSAVQIGKQKHMRIECLNTLNKPSVQTLSSLNRLNYYITVLCIGALTVLSGCSLSPTEKTLNSQTTNTVSLTDKTTRNEQMLQLSAWEITGKIAFLTPKKRQSATFFWQHLNEQEQHVNLTTFLGINLMELTSQSGLHTITVRNETYQSDDLNTLIYQLTHFQLPTEALQYWLKGLTYLPSDTIIIDTETYLPKQLTSNFNDQKWQIQYQNYQLFEQYQLATKITIKQADLTIKIVINHWEL